MGQFLTRLPDLSGPATQPYRGDRSYSKNSRRRSLSRAKVDSGPGLYEYHSRTPSSTRQERRGRTGKGSRTSRETDGKSRKAEVSGKPRVKDGKQRRQLSQSRKNKEDDETSKTPWHRKPRTPRAERRLPRHPNSKHHHYHHKPIPKAGFPSVEVIEVEGSAGLKNDCMICIETRSTRHFPHHPPTTQCSHKSNTCKRCLRHWIRTQFETKVWDQITCPECSMRMGYEDMRHFAPSDVFRRYDRLSTKAALESIPGFRWCIAKGCRSGQVHDEGNATPRFRCVACNKSHCVVHQIAWHKGETCAEYDYRTDGRLKKAEEDASRTLIKDTAKRCPGCQWNIEKRNGCDHMTCSKCRHEFCWTCLAPYGPIRDHGNQMHRPGCQHHG